jgi:pimeloyl-ACP methyl ester carboxylesterase
MQDTWQSSLGAGQRQSTRENTVPFQLSIIATLAAGAMMLATPAMAEQKPTVVLVHGAFADSSSWNGVIRTLEADGYPVVAAANPLRSVKGDARSVSGLLSTIAGPVVLVGHYSSPRSISASGWITTATGWSARRR